MLRRSVEARVRRRNAALLIVTYVFFLCAPGQATDCPQSLSHYAGVAVTRPVAWTAQGIGFAIKTALYPAFGLFKVGRYAMAHAEPSVWDLAGRVIREDKYSILGYLALAGLMRGTGYTLYQYQKDTHEFDDADPDGLTVVVDAFQDDRVYPYAGTYVFQTKYKDRPNTVLISPRDWDDLIRQLRDLVAKRGMPIKKMDIYGHGLPGWLQTWGPQLLGRGGYFGQAGLPNEDFERLPYTLKNMTLRGVFDRDAKIRLNSCFVGNGNRGDLFLHDLGDALLERGGTIYSSQVQIVPNLTEGIAFELGLPKPPDWLRALGEPLSVGASLMTAYDLENFRYHLRDWNDDPRQPFASNGPWIWDRTKIEKVPEPTTASHAMRKAVLDFEEGASQRIRNFTIEKWSQINKRLSLLGGRLDFDSTLHTDVFDSFALESWSAKPDDRARVQQAISELHAPYILNKAVPERSLHLVIKPDFSNPELKRLGEAIRQAGELARTQLHSLDTDTASHTEVIRYEAQLNQLEQIFADRLKGDEP